MLQCDTCRYKPQADTCCSNGSIIDAAQGSCLGYHRASPWLTNVSTGAGLDKFIAIGSQYSNRDCYAQLQKYIYSTSRKVCALFGLRRTGKTIMLYQLLAELDKSKTAYLQLTPNNDMIDLETDLLRLQKLGITTVLVDEITFASDFATCSNMLADYFTTSGMKLVLSGADSLGFILAHKRILFDRLELIHTTYISYPEHHRLLGTDIDDYIRYGGTLLPEGQTPFSSLASAEEYRDSAIVNNIQHAFQVLDADPDFYTLLKEAYTKGALSGMINRILEDIRHCFIARLYARKFRSTNLGALYQKLLSRLKNADRDALETLEFIGAYREALTDNYQRSLQIKNYIPTESELTELQQYLFNLDILATYDVVDQSYVRSRQVIFTQPGMQFSLARMLMQDCTRLPEFESLRITEQEYMLKFLETNTLGHILEDIVIEHTENALLKPDQNLHQRFRIFQYSGTSDEIDMVVVDTSQQATHLYEIKHSSVAVAAQAKHICNMELCGALAEHYYPIASRNVLYLGPNVTRYIRDSEFSDETSDSLKIDYLNIETYLNNLTKSQS